MFGPHVRRAALAQALTVPQGLVGYWPLDLGSLNWGANKSFDRSGRGNDGTLSGFSSSSLAAGKIRQGLTFGSPNYISVPRSAVLEPSGSVTLMAWAKPSSLPADCTLISRPYRNSGWTTPFISYQLAPTAGGTNKPRFALTVAGAIKNLNGSAALVAGNWVHLAGVYDGSSLVLYVNGRRDSSLSQTGSIDYTNATNVDFGLRSEYSTGEFFPGPAQQIRIYNRALTAQEVLSIYTAGLSGLA